MHEVHVEVLQESPSLATLYARAVLPAVPGLRLLPRLGAAPALMWRRGVAPSELPDVRLELPEIRPDARHVASYRDVTGLPARPTLPVTYPHVLAFPLHLRLMTDARFPFAAMGTVHIDNRIEQRRPLAADEPFDLAVWVERLAPHAKGQTVTVVSEASAGDAAVWRGETVLLSRGRPHESTEPEPTDLPESAPNGPTRWPLPSDLGRRYAAVSGDRNPIHLYDVTAKLFGFRRHIAHGMWTKARCLAALENRLPPAFTVKVAFKKPVELPGTVAFGARDRDDRIDFGLTSPSSGAPHLLGRLTRS